MILLYRGRQDESFSTAVETLSAMDVDIVRERSDAPALEALDWFALPVQQDG